MDAWRKAKANMTAAASRATAGDAEIHTTEVGGGTATVANSAIGGGGDSSETGGSRSWHEAQASGEIKCLVGVDRGAVLYSGSANLRVWDSATGRNTHVRPNPRAQQFSASIGGSSGRSSSHSAVLPGVPQVVHTKRSLSSVSCLVAIESLGTVLSGHTDGSVNVIGPGQRQPLAKLCHYAAPLHLCQRGRKEGGQNEKVLDHGQAPMHGAARSPQVSGDRAGRRPGVGPAVDRLGPRDHPGNDRPAADTATRLIIRRGGAVESPKWRVDVRAHVLTTVEHTMSQVWAGLGAAAERLAELELRPPKGQARPLE